MMKLKRGLIAISLVMVAVLSGVLFSGCEKDNSKNYIEGTFSVYFDADYIVEASSSADFMTPSDYWSVAMAYGFTDGLYAENALKLSNDGTYEYIKLSVAAAKKALIAKDLLF